MPAPVGAPESREQDTILLATSLYDYLPLPKAPVLAEAGLSASRYVPCDACGSRGRVFSPGVVCVRCPPRKSPLRGPPPFDTGHGCTPCLNCRGDGWRLARPSDDPWDGYAGLPLGAAEAGSRKPWEREQDTARQLGRTDFLLRLWTDETLDEPWEEQRKRQFKAGHYEELINALRALERQAPDRVRLFHRVLIVREELELSTAAAAGLAITIRQVARLMPKEIRVPRHLREADALRKTSLWRGRTPAHLRQKAARDEQIVSLVGTLGASVLALRYDLTVKRISQIVGSAA